MIGRQKELKQLVEQISICNTVLIGAAGTGKTSLINALVNQYSDKFKPILLINGRKLSDSFDAEFRIWKYIREHSPNTGRRPLVIIDGLDEIPLSSSSPSIFLDGLARSSECHFIASTRPNSHTLFSTAMPLDDFRVIELKGFTQQEIFFFLAQSHMDCSTQQVNKLAHLSNGNPLILSVLVNQLKTGMLSWDELSTALNEFQASGLVHPNGNTIIPSSKASRSIISDVTFTNKQIWNEL